jgi:hypothetical protein
MAAGLRRQKPAVRAGITADSPPGPCEHDVGQSAEGETQMTARLIAAGLLLATLGACASTPAEPAAPPSPDYRAALLKPCANTSDWAPWLLVDAWADGEVYEPETQFRADGVMLYAYDGRKFDNGKWTLEGQKLHFDTNNHYADYDGVFDGERASGTMKNTGGDQGKWTLVRACDG